MHPKNINMDKLIQKTVFFLNTYPSSESLSPRNLNSLWSRVCIEIFGKFSFTDALLIQTWWKRDKGGFRNKVNLSINENESINLIRDIHTDISNEKIDGFKELLIFDNEDIIFLKKIISDKGANGRKYFRKAFDNILTIKMKKFVPCALNCVSNWFRKIDGRKSTLPYWRAKFNCLFEKCETTFNAFSLTNIETSETFEVFIEWTGEVRHEVSFEKKRCTGQQRNSLGIELKANGIENTRNQILIKSKQSLLNTQLNQYNMKLIIIND